MAFHCYRDEETMLHRGACFSARSTTKLVSLSAIGITLAAVTVSRRSFSQLQNSARSRSILANVFKSPSFIALSLPHSCHRCQADQEAEGRVTGYDWSGTPSFTSSRILDFNSLRSMGLSRKYLAPRFMHSVLISSVG